AGRLEFFDGSTDLGPGQEVANDDTSATWTLTTSALNAGGHPITAVFEDSTSLDTSTSAVFYQTVNKADANITVTGYTGQYDGQAHGLTGSATGVTGEDLSGLLDLGSQATHVSDSTTVTWAFAGNDNYNAATGSGALVITPADADVAVDGAFL